MVAEVAPVEVEEAPVAEDRAGAAVRAEEVEALDHQRQAVAQTPEAHHPSAQVQAPEILALRPEAAAERVPPVPQPVVPPLAQEARTAVPVARNGRRAEPVPASKPAQTLIMVYRVIARATLLARRTMAVPERQSALAPIDQPRCRA